MADIDTTRHERRARAIKHGITTLEARAQDERTIAALDELRRKLDALTSAPATPPKDDDFYQMPDEPSPGMDEMDGETPTNIDAGKKAYDGPKIDSLARFLEDDPERFNPEMLPAPPMHIFNDEVNLIVERVSETKCIPAEMSLGIVLGLVSACVGRARGISPRKDWREHANLFFMLIAETGSGKSHAYNYIFKELKKEEAARKARYKQECRVYAEEMAVFRKSKDSNKKMPERPVNVQYLLDDSTMEAASERMEDNPKGLFWSIDEMSGFFTSLDKYNKAGNDGKRRLLSAFNAETWNTSRKSKDGMSEERYIAKGAMGIFGGIQPHLLNSLFSYDDVKQGLPQRFLYVRAVIDKPLEFDTPEIPAEVDTIIERITRRLLSLEMDLDQYGDWQARYLPLEPAARKVFNHFGDSMTSRSFGTEAYGFAVKLAQLTLRLALILHHLEWASAPAERECPAVISYDTMTAAISLANWFGCHTQAVRQHFPTCAPEERQQMKKEHKKRSQLEELLDFIDENQAFCEQPHTAGEILGRMGKPIMSANTYGRFLVAQGFECKIRHKTGTYTLYPLPARGE